MARVLVVDDLEMMTELVRGFLVHAGHEAVTATDGAAALELFRRQAFDLIITDLVMPGTSGLDLLRQIHAQSPAIPVLIMTGQPSVEAAVECLKSGAADFLLKPLDANRFLDVVTACLTSRTDDLGTIVMPAHASLTQVGGYRVKSVLGAGGCGIVYLADQTSSTPPLPVALKVLRDGLEPEVRSRFAREAEVVSQFNHPNIVRIWDFDVSPEARVPYIAMEYVPGLTLRAAETHPGRPRALDVRDRAAILRQIAAALTVIHAHGICHRDIKPHNVMITSDLQVKLTDFGIVRTFDSGLTGTGNLLGTPSYMSPEGFSGGAVDPRADLFSLGVLGYELYLRQLPFVGSTIVALAREVNTGRPLAPRRIEPELPEALERLLARLLRKDVSSRYQSAAEVAADLDAFLAGSPLPNCPPPAPGDAPDWD